MVKKIFRKIFDIFGLEVTRIPKDGETGAFLPPMRNTMQASLIHLKRIGFNPDLIIDVGTADGTFPLLKVFPEAKFFWIEPLSEFEGALKKLESKYKGDYKIAAAGKIEGKIKINVHSDLVGTSLLNEAEGGIADGQEREVEIFRLDSKYKLEDLKNKKIIVKIDVQGAEIDVIEGMGKLVSEVDVFILEVSFFEFHNNSPQIFDIITYMKSHDFVAYDIFDGHNRPLDGALAQKDIMFVKDDGFFRKSNNWATIEQRKQYLGIK